MRVFLEGHIKLCCNPKMTLVRAPPNAHYHSLVLNPKRGQMFWIAEEPNLSTIKLASMDGKNVSASLNFYLLLNYRSERFTPTSRYIQLVSIHTQISSILPNPTQLLLLTWRLCKLHIILLQTQPVFRMQIVSCTSTMCKFLFLDV